jgi:hypothetical protein
MDFSKNVLKHRSNRKRDNEEDSDDDNLPDESNLSFFPDSVRSPVLLMSAVNLTVGLLPTIIFGVIAPSYPDEYFQRDAEAVGRFGLNITDPTQVIQIKLKPVAGTRDKLDTQDAINLLQQALSKINNVASCIRIVRVGITGTNFFFDAVKYLLKEWNFNGNKKVKFVTAGDNGTEMFDFCRSLCLSGVCAEIEFYNTHDYHPFGQFKSKWYRP